ncbi:MAG: type II toxin-antitoxin system HicA family toxin [Patescibacteria group bacterium]
MSKTFSGKEVVKVLCREFGFFVVSQRGSHIKLNRKNGNRTIVTIVPMHRELAHGTLLGLLEMAEIDISDFIKSA